MTEKEMQAMLRALNYKVHNGLENESNHAHSPAFSSFPNKPFSFLLQNAGDFFVSINLDRTYNLLSLIEYGIKIHLFPHLHLILQIETWHLSVLSLASPS